ncbi:MAG: hypothetical protein GF418_08195 [Chitinivibrionales bacterium]|nr:hypothetical protein [Chitinivibrionales bacterium]MBD3395594.1 hypothetical protein [Chitinivibrionales bacterium]
MVSRAMHYLKLAALTSLLVFSFSNAAEKKMVLITTEGDELQLFQNNTWMPVKGQEILYEKDFTVPLPDGRHVLINVDGTWGFVTEELLYAEDLLTTKKVVGKGRATHIDVNIATDKAKKKAFDNTVVKAKNALRKMKKIDYKQVPDCIKRVEKDIEVSEQFAKSSGWTVQVLITLDEGSLLAVVECAHDTTAKQDN